MTSHRVTVYAAGNEARQSTTVVHNPVDDVAELLRAIGLEYKQADFMPTRQVVIVIDPIDNPVEDVRERIAEARQKLDALMETL